MITEGENDMKSLVQFFPRDNFFNRSTPIAFSVEQKKKSKRCELNRQPEGSGRTSIDKRQCLSREIEAETKKPS